MLKDVIEQANKCTGCSACYAICPQHAISITEDPVQYYGFVAKYESSLCVGCGKCTKICPVLTPEEKTNRIHPDCYAVSANNTILLESSSGGVFTLIAETILSLGGVICGAAYDSNFHVRHILIESSNDLYKIRRSKYVQSYVGDIYLKIKSIINERKVLFVGVPCQVAGLKKYIGENPNLYCVDLYCAQTPPDHLFQLYLKTNFDNHEISSYDFRTKQNGWVHDTVTVKFTDGKESVLNQQTDSYQQCYHSRLCMRKVCECCQFSAFPRQGDLSIADFWWIEESYPDLKNPLGTSALLVNNKKGESLLPNIKNMAVCFESVNLEAMKKNRPSKITAHPMRDRFFSLLERRSFNDAVSTSLNHQYDVVVWGNWTERNYGSELTYYALYQVLTHMGMEVLMVERPKTAVWGPNDSPVLFNNNPYPDYACLIPENKPEMFRLNQVSNTFIVGSDQIWHPNLYDCFGQVCYLDYIYSFYKKIAYASSFGCSSWIGSSISKLTARILLNDFDYISVREPSGVKICNDEFQIHADWVLDPVFLCPLEDYICLIQSSTILKEKKSPYIAVYVLDANNDKEELIRASENTLQMESFIVTDAFVSNVETTWQRNVHANTSIEDWLANIYYSDFVITDSFHGMCFSIIMHKQFVAIGNAKRGLSRFVELLHLLDLEDRLLEPGYTTDDLLPLLHHRIDYFAVDKKLSAKIESSKAWLRHALQSPKSSTFDHSTLLEKRIYDLNEMIDNLFQSFSNKEKIQNWHTERLDYHDKIQNWHTERLDYHDKIQEWHTQRLDGLEERISKQPSYKEKINHAMSTILSSIRGRQKKNP